MKSSLPIEFRGKLISLPIDIDYHRAGGHVDLLSARVSGTDILGLLDRTEIIALRASVLTREGGGVKLGLPITWRGVRINLPLEIECQVLFGQPNILAAWMNGFDVWPLLHQEERVALSRKVLEHLRQSGSSMAGLSHIPPELRDIAQEEQERALRESEVQKGVRHVL